MLNAPTSRTAWPSPRNKSPMAFFNSNPAWSDPMTSFIVVSLSESLFRSGDHVFYGEPELLQQVFERGRRAEGVHPYRFALGADVTFPAERGGHFDGNAGS